jgi:KDO2-lipid IV(A) lauroyltransferase
VELTVGGLRAASAAVEFVPRPVAHAAGRLVGVAAARLSAEQRTMAERNQRRVHGPDHPEAELRRGVDEVFASYARYWVDSLRLPGLTVEEVDRGFSYTGLEHVAASLDRGIGPILALPHLGGWEWAARWLVAVRGWPVSAVAEELDPPELNEWFLDYRRRLGMEVITLGPSAGTEVSRAVASGRIMCLLCDRDLSGSGIEVEFFGERTTLPGGPALMALRTGAPLLPTAVYFEGDHCRGVVDEPLDTVRRGKLREDVARVTQDLARALERQIRRAPEQWHLLQPNWPSDHRALGRPVPGGGDGERSE